jgi:hypothetical protein
MVFSASTGPSRRREGASYATSPGLPMVRRLPWALASTRSSSGTVTRASRLPDCWLTMTGHSLTSPGSKSPPSNGRRMARWSLGLARTARLGSGMHAWGNCSTRCTTSRPHMQELQRGRVSAAKYAAGKREPLPAPRYQPAGGGTGGGRRRERGGGTSATAPAAYRRARIEAMPWADAKAFALESPNGQPVCAELQPPVSSLCL